MSQIHFASPAAFILFIPLAALLYIHLRWRKNNRLHFPALSWFAPKTFHIANVAILSVTIARFLILAALVFILARPQLGSVETERLTEGIDIILAIDASESMKAMDFMQNNQRVDRLEVVKSVATDFVKNRSDDRVGIVVFGDHAFTQCPPTYDHESVANFLDWLFIGMAGSRTAIGSAVAISTKRLEALPGKSKVVILLTDGRSTVNDIEPVNASQMAAALGIKIYTIGVGSDQPVPIPVDGIFGRRFVRQRLELDEDLLRAIAQSTGGLYFNAKDTDGLKAIYARIDELEKSEVKIREFRNYEDIYLSWLNPLVLVLLVLMVLDSTLLRRTP